MLMSTCMLWLCKYTVHFVTCMFILSVINEEKKRGKKEKKKKKGGICLPLLPSHFSGSSAICVLVCYSSRMFSFKRVDLQIHTSLLPTRIYKIAHHFIRLHHVIFIWHRRDLSQNHQHLLLLVRLHVFV